MELLRDRIKRDTFMVQKLCGMIARGDLRDDHPQQRKSGQWDRETRDNFIVTVIRNEDFDPIKICEQLTEYGIVLWLIDGLQRSTTIEDFKAGRFSLGRKIDPCFIEYQEAIRGKNGKFTYENISYDLRGKSYKDLPEKLKEDFNNCQVSVVKHLACTDEEVGRHIVRYNSGRPMKVAQKISAYMSNTAKDIKTLSAHAFFNDCANFSVTKDKGGEIDKAVCEALMTINFFDVWNKDAKVIGRHLNENATKEMFDRFNQQLDRLLNVITPETGKIFAGKNALLFFKLFDEFSKTGRSDALFQEFLEHFDELKRRKITIEKQYELAKGSGVFTNTLSFAELDGVKSSKDKGLLTDKFYVLEHLLREFLKEHEEYMDEELNNETQTCSEFVKENVGEVLDDDIELFEMVANDVSDAVDEDSWLISDDNRKAYLSIVGYAIRDDKEDLLRNWMSVYEKNNLFNPNQKEGFLHMKTNFNVFAQNVEMGGA